MDVQHTEHAGPPDTGDARQTDGEGMVRPLPRYLTQAFLVQLDRLFEAHNDKAYDRKGKSKRNCGDATKGHRRAEIRCVFLDLVELGYRLQHPKNLSRRHLSRLAEHWKDKGLSPQTLNRRFSMLRVFCRWMGKREIVLDLKEYYPDPAIYKRSAIAKESLSWEAKKVDPLEQIERAKRLDERYGLYLSLQHHFGMRVKESIQFKPLLSWTGGDLFELYEGTKGGRHRVQKIQTPEQRAVIEWAIEVAKRSPEGRVRWPGRSWSQAQEHFKYLQKKMGLTRKEMGVTAHGLRHGRAQRQYTVKTGTKTPVEGMDPKQMDPAAHKRAMQEIAWELGHGRPVVTATYCGSVGHALRQPREWVAKVMEGISP